MVTIGVHGEASGDASPPKMSQLTKVVKIVMGFYHGSPRVVKLKVGLHHGCPGSDHRSLGVVKLVMGLHHGSPSVVKLVMKFH